METVIINGVNDTCQGHIGTWSTHAVCSSEFHYWCCQSCAKIRNNADLGMVVVMRIVFSYC